MASVKYSYVKSVNPAKLDHEIRTSAIVTALDYISTVSTAIDVWFKSALSESDETLLDSIIEGHVNSAFPVDPPIDSDGSPIIRRKETKTGWHYQMHTVEISTSTESGIYSKKIVNPALTVFSPVDTGFVTTKYYDAGGSELTEATGGAFPTCVATVMDWAVDHEMEIISGKIIQDTSPTSDLRLWIVAAPGIANVDFAEGGFNLKHCGQGMAIYADGKASKYMHPTDPMPGINKFRVIALHPAGFQHTFMIVFNLYKAI